MLLAPVVPPGNEVYLPNNLGAYFCFTPNVLSTPSYAAYYSEKSARGAVVIMDCPIYEGGQHVSEYDFERACELVNPTFAIIPDVRANCIETLIAATGFAPAPCATGVIQAVRPEEVLICARAYAQMGLGRVGIPKDLIAHLGLPRALITAMLPGLPAVHWLGGNWPYDEVAPVNVISFDTAEPFNAAIYGIDLELEAPRARPSNWSKLVLKDVALFHHNIEVIRARCS